MKAGIMVLVMAFAALGALSSAAVPMADLGGTCSPNVITHAGQALVLNVSDRGDAVAVNLLAVPEVFGAATVQSASSPGVTPVSSALFSFPLRNLSRNGTYPAGFLLQYYLGQDPLPYYAYFACLYSINASTKSALRIDGLGTTGTGSARSIGATLYNSGDATVNATMGFLAPVGFVINGTPAAVALRPYAPYNASFGLSTSSAVQNGTFALWFYATYVHGGLAYASLVPVEVQSMPQVPRQNRPAALVVAAAVAVLLAALAALRLRASGHGHGHARRRVSHARKG